MPNEDQKPTTAIEQPAEDALAQLAQPVPSSRLEVLRAVSKGHESIVVQTAAQAAPSLPDEHKLCRAGRIGHILTTLTSLQDFVRFCNGDGEDATQPRAVKSPVIFYMTNKVELVLDHASWVEEQVVVCQPAHSQELQVWEEAAEVSSEGPLTHAQFVELLLSRREDILRGEKNSGTAEADAATAVDMMIGEFRSLAGALAYESTEHDEHVAKSMSFTVRQKRGRQDPEDNDVTVRTRFLVAVRLLQDDDEITTLEVRLTFRNTVDNPLYVRVSLDGLDQAMAEHIEARIGKFVEETSVPAFAGKSMFLNWAEPNLPEAVSELMTRQVELLAAAHPAPSAGQGKNYH